MKINFLTKIKQFVSIRLETPRKKKKVNNNNNNNKMKSGCHQVVVFLHVYRI